MKTGSHRWGRLSRLPALCMTLGAVAAPTAHRRARRMDEGREERDSVLDLHQVMIQTAVLKATSLCLRARSWLDMPRPTAAELEDPVQIWAELGAGTDI